MIFGGRVTLFVGNLVVPLAGIPMALAAVGMMVVAVFLEPAPYLLSVPLADLPTMQHGRVDLQTAVDPAAGRPLPDGGMVWALGPEAHTWAWCASAPSSAVDVRGPVVGWRGAHRFAAPIEAAMDEHLPGRPGLDAHPALIAVEGCGTEHRNSGTAWPSAPWRIAPPAEIFVRDGVPVRAQAIALGGSWLIPLSSSDAPVERVSAWVVCAGAPGPEGPPTRGSVLGHAGAGNLPRSVAMAIADAEQVGGVGTVPWAPVIDAGTCARR